MKTIAIRLGTLFVSMLFLFAANETYAAGKSVKKKVAKTTASKVTLQGEVSKQANAKGKLTLVEFRSNEGKNYRVALNRNGLKLGKEMHGKKAEVVGIVVVRGTKKKPVEWLQVKTFKEITAPPVQEEEPNEGDSEDSESDSDSDSNDDSDY